MAATLTMPPTNFVSWWLCKTWEGQELTTPGAFAFERLKQESQCSTTTAADDRFCRTEELSELDAHGGGNIQIHQSRMGHAVVFESNNNCVCDEEKIKSHLDAGGGTFVTGGRRVCCFCPMPFETQTEQSTGSSSTSRPTLDSAENSTKATLWCLMAPPTLTMKEMNSTSSTAKEEEARNTISWRFHPQQRLDGLARALGP
jgi:hypothetical protein